MLYAPCPMYALHACCPLCATATCILPVSCWMHAGLPTCFCSVNIAKVLLSGASYWLMFYAGRWCQLWVWRLRERKPFAPLTWTSCLTRARKSRNSRWVQGKMGLVPFYLQRGWCHENLRVCLIVRALIGEQGLSRCPHLLRRVEAQDSYARHLLCEHAFALPGTGFTFLHCSARRFWWLLPCRFLAFSCQVQTCVMVSHIDSAIPTIGPPKCGQFALLPAHLPHCQL